MKMTLAFVVAAASAAVLPAAQQSRGQTAAPAPSAINLPAEKHLRNVKQLTNAGENAEAYFSFDGQRLAFMSTAGHDCDRIYTMKIDGTDRKMVSTGTGRTTCPFYYPDGKHILYASTHLGAAACPTPPDQSLGYVWGIFDTYDIFRADADGKNLVQLTKTPGYDAEATIAKDGKVVFTSVRDGDMEIYTMNGDGSDVRRLTHAPGPDGGPFFSADGTKIVFRGQHPEPGKALDDYFTLLKKAVWRPTTLDVFVMDRDGKNMTQVTKNMGGANWAPFFTPDGKRIIFASNFKDQNARGRAPNFDLFLINIDGTGLEQVTFNESFDGFPMFSPDGKKLVFASNRHDKSGTETNIFIADWIW